MKAKASTKTKETVKQETPPSTDPREDLREETHRKIVAFLGKELARTGPRECVSLALFSAQPGIRGESLFAWDWSTNGAVEANKNRSRPTLALDIIRMAEAHAEAFVDEIRRYELRSEQRTGGLTRHAFRILQEGVPDDPPVTHPFVLKIEASGVHVDVRVDSARSMNEIARAISSGLFEALRPVLPLISLKLQEIMPGGISPSQMADIVSSVASEGDSISLDLVGMTSQILSGSHAPNDAQLDMILDLLRAERARRVESRS